MDLGVWVGFCWLCKLFRKSEVVLVGGISENRNNIGFGFGFSDWDRGCGKRCGKVGKEWGFALGGVVEK